MESMPPESVAGTEVDWKTQLPVSYRRMVVSKLSEWIMRNISAGLRDAPRVESMAIKFEEKVFSTATTKEDYMRKICLKLQEPIKPRPQQSMPKLSPPSPAYSVENSTHQASLQPQYHGPGRPLDPSAGVNHPLPHQRLGIHHQGTKPDQLKPTLQQHQNLNVNNSRANVQHKVTDLLSQHKLYGLNKYSDGNMHQLGQQVNASTFSEQTSNIGMQRSQGNILPKTELQLQALGLQPEKQPPNLQIRSQMQVQPQEFNTKVMAEGTSQTIHSVGNDWKEELFNKITSLKASFLPALMVKHGEIVNVLKKMNSIPQYRRPTDYERLQKQLVMHRKVHSFLNFSKDKMCKEIQRWLPQCEKGIYILLQDRSRGHVSFPQQKQLPTSDAQSLQQPVQLQYETKQQIFTSQVEDRQLYQRQMPQKLSHHREQRGLHHPPPFNLLAHHSPQSKQAINILQNESVRNCLLSNHQLVKSEPVSTPSMNILEKSSPNIGNPSPSTFSVDPRSTSSVQSPMNENHSIVHNANDEISPSGLLEENANITGKQTHISGRDLRESSLPEEPIQRLIKAARSMSPYKFSASVRGMESVLRLVDRTARQLTVNGSEFAVDNLTGNTTCRYRLERNVSSQATLRNSYETAIPVSSFESGMINGGLNNLIDSESSHSESSIATNGKRQRIEARSMARNTFAADEDLVSFDTFCHGLKQEVGSQTTQRSLYATSIPVSGMINDGLKHQNGVDASELESSKPIHDKKHSIEVHYNLLEEIRNINVKLIETMVEISEDVSETALPMTESGEGTVVRCFYTPVAISPIIKSELGLSPIMPLKLLVPINYPADSPVVLDKLPSESSMDCEDLSAKAKSKLLLGLQVLRAPMSLAEIAKTWDTCARAAISEFAQKLGGGNFSSTYGTWRSTA